MGSNLLKVAGWASVVLLISACNNNYKVSPNQTGASLNTPTSSDPSDPSNPSNPSNPAPPTCTIQSVNRNLRIIFMVDDSGSTKTTDPNDTNRVATVQNFINTYGSKTNLTYSYSYFGDNASTYSISGNNFGSSAANVFGDAADAQSALNKFEALPVGGAGSTNYDNAFSRIKNIISADDPSQNDQSYVVVFMSDGQPTDLGSGATNQINGITQLAHDLMALAVSGRITLSTVYFGPATDTQAQNNLQTMAALGSGQFVNTNTTTSFSIDNLITVPGTACN